MNIAPNFETNQADLDDKWAFGAYMPTAYFEAIPAADCARSGSHRSLQYYPRQKGMVARNYQWIYLARGGGRVETQPGGIHELAMGDLCIVHPGIWHRSQPNPETGWDKYSAELGGDYLRRLMHHPLFTAKKPIYSLGLDAELQALFRKAIEILDLQSAGFQFLTGALGVQIVAHSLAILKRRGLVGAPVEDIVREAKELLTWPEFAEMRLERFVAQFRISYSTFRRLFKEQTGVSPRQYALNACIHRAKDLLLKSERPVHAIAKELGFTTVPYFCRLFKKKTGLSPSEMRHFVVPLISLPNPVSQTAVTTTVPQPTPLATSA